MSALRFARPRRGMTLVEILVAMSVLLVLGLMTTALMRASLEVWSQAERQRRVYARARAVFDCMQDDFSAALTRDPAGAPPTARMICQPDPANGNRPVLMLVRTFGSGWERAYTFGGDDGKSTQPAEAGGAPAQPAPAAGVDQHYTSAGIVPGGPSRKPIVLGGAAQVAYIHEGRQLKRALCSPCMPTFNSIFQYAQPLAEDVLYFEMLFATPYTTTWQEQAAGNKGKRWPLVPTPKDGFDQAYGPERTWDSTRGVLPDFCMWSGKESLADGEDDVFPDRVRVTVVLEPSEVRTVRTETLGQIDDITGQITVASTRGFPGAGTDDSYILVDNEWMHYTAMDAKSFTVDVRGARGTARALHADGAVVRCGVAFTRTFFLPGYRKEAALGSSGRNGP